jgi:hypothetical protein
VSSVDRVIRWSTAGAVLGVAAVAAVASYEHAHDLVRAHGEYGWTGTGIGRRAATDHLAVAPFPLAPGKLLGVHARRAGLPERSWARVASRLPVTRAARWCP